MKIDLEKLKQQAQVEVEESSKSGDRNGDYPIVYPGENGKLTVKLLYNIKAGLVQRRISRHDSGKTKVACLGQYGNDCPVCNAINEAETNLGKECGAFRKYGWKTRGICFAQIIDHEATYFTKDTDPKKGDIVILMYPKTVYEMINKIIIDSVSQGVNLVSENEGIPIVIERSQKGNAFPSYNAYLFAYGPRKSFESDSEGTGDEKFDALLESLPDLCETIIPKYPNEETLKQASALAETIAAEYSISNSSVVNPNSSNDVPNNNTEPKVGNMAEVPKSNNSNTQSENETDNSVPVNTSNNSDKPGCFGKHENGAKKCMLCPMEEECFTSAN